MTGAFAQDPYATLGLRHDASADEIRAAWKRLALATHPDKTDDDGAQFRAVQAAYEVLSAPAKHWKPQREPRAPLGSF